MLVSNTLFRMGGAGVLLSSRWRHKSILLLLSNDGVVLVLTWLLHWTGIAKYKLNTTVRVHHGADDASYHSIYQKSDDEGLVGVALSKSLLKVVGAALKSNMTTLGPQVRACVCVHSCAEISNSNFVCDTRCCRGRSNCGFLCRCASVNWVAKAPSMYRISIVHLTIFVYMLEVVL